MVPSVAGELVQAFRPRLPDWPGLAIRRAPDPRSRQSRGMGRDGNRGAASTLLGQTAMT
jgi:hypothetical protein